MSYVTKPSCRALYAVETNAGGVLGSSTSARSRRGAAFGTGHFSSADMIGDGRLWREEDVRRTAYVEAFDSLIEETQASMARVVVGLVAHQYGDPAPPTSQALRRWWVDWKAQRQKLRSSLVPRLNPLKLLVWEMLDGISGPERRVTHQGSAVFWAHYLMDIVHRREIALPGGLPSTGTMVRLVREYRKVRRPAPRKRVRSISARWEGPWPLPPACPRDFHEGAR